MGAVDGDIATVGITAYAAEQLGDVVFVELPEIGAQGEEGRRRRGGGIGEGGERRLQPGLRRGRGDERGAHRQSAAGERRRRGRRLVHEDQDRRQERARRPPGRGGLPGFRRRRSEASHGARIPGDDRLAARHGRGFRQGPLQPRARMALRRRHHGARLVLAERRAAPLLARGRGRPGGDVRRRALELPHADLPRPRAARRLRDRFLRGRGDRARWSGSRRSAWRSPR